MTQGINSYVEDTIVVNVSPKKGRGVMLNKDFVID